MIESLLPPATAPRLPARDAVAAARAALRTEVSDALRRRQHELPASLLAHCDPGLRARACTVPDACLTSTERALLDAWLPAMLGALMVPPAALVEHAPRCSDAGDAVLALAAAEGRVLQVALVDRDVRLLDRRMARLAPVATDGPLLAVGTDPTLAMPLPRTLARPRLHLLPGNALGALGTLGAIRALRVLRAGLEPADLVLLGLDLRTDGAALEAAFGESGAVAALAIDLLAAANRELGADFPLDAFTHAARWDAEFARLELLLVATRAVRVRVPDGAEVSLRKGQAIRTGLHATWDRRRVAAMLAAMGLSLAAWHEDGAGEYGIALARVHAGGGP